jgi:chorismate dehydratase
MARHARPVRVGTVDYLNARPLVHGLEHGAIELSRAVPATLADRMAGGELDLALLPVIELARMPDLELAPGCAIASRGAARSVLLVSRKSPRSIETLAVDPESRTSNALARVVLDRSFGRRPEIVPAGHDLAATLARTDAAVRIGDKALFEPVPADLHVTDLGQAWTEATGMPFVFAAWAARPGVLDEELCRTLLASRDLGLRAIDTIARDYEWRGRRDPDLARDYLRHNIRYELGSEEIAAMGAFFRAAEEAGVIASAPPVRIALGDRAAAPAVGGRRAGP